MACAAKKPEAKTPAAVQKEVFMVVRQPGGLALPEVVGGVAALERDGALEMHWQCGCPLGAGYVRCDRCGWQG